MSKQDLITCDICVRTKAADDENEKLHIKRRVGVRTDSIWRLTTKPVDVCSDCLDLIEFMRQGDSEVAPAVSRILKYLYSMCTADQYKFEEELRKLAKKIDRYSDNHRDVYKPSARPITHQESESKQ